MEQSSGRNTADPSSGLKPAFRPSLLLQDPTTTTTRKDCEGLSPCGIAGPHSAFVLWVGTDPCLLQSLWDFEI